MVGGRGTEEAKRAAREARLRREKRKKYEALLEEHPKVKALQARRAPRVEKGPVKRGVPKLIAEAMEDPEVATAVAAVQRMMRYEERIDCVVRMRQRGEKVSLKDEIALIRQGENIEPDVQAAVRTLAGKALRDPKTEAFATAIASWPDDTEVLDDFPSYLTRDELAVLRYLGMKPDAVKQVWETEVMPRRQKARQLPSYDQIRRELEKLETSADTIEYPRAPRHLVKRDVLTLGGQTSSDLSQAKFWFWVGIITFVMLVAIIACVTCIPGCNVVFGYLSVSILL